MSNRTIQNNQLQAGTTFAVRGKLAYSRIVSKIEGEELERDIQRRKMKGWIPIERPYTTVTVNSAAVIYKDPNVKTPEEIYAEESFYTSQAQKAQGFSYTTNNKGNNLPWIGQMKSDNSSQVDQIYPEGELASGLDVTLIMRVFQGKPNKGVALDGVIVNEPIRYFNNAQAGFGVDSLGLTFNHAAAPAPTMPAQKATPRTTPEAAPFAPAQPVANYGDPNANAFSAGQQAPAPQAQPATEPMPTNPLPYQDGQGGGIRYNPQGGNTSGNGRDY